MTKEQSDRLLIAALQKQLTAERIARWQAQTEARTLRVKNRRLRGLVAAARAALLARGRPDGPAAVNDEQRA